ncbi:MAG: hypothetical protein SFV15_19790 [Polyangiaceae bacterium]|nr:hypothetical protein [Polyangiaceae bacterium]
MKIPYRAYPGVGFVIVVVGCSAALALFAWGLLTPPLETVWRLQVELLVGRREALAEDEVHVLQKTLERYPALAKNLLNGQASGQISANSRGLVENGYAYLVRRTKESPRVLSITPVDISSEKPVEVRIQVNGEKLQPGRAQRSAPLTRELPQTGPFPQLIEVRFGSQKSKTISQAPPVNIQLRGRP